MNVNSTNERRSSNPSTFQVTFSAFNNVRINNNLSENRNENHLTDTLTPTYPISYADSSPYLNSNFNYRNLYINPSIEQHHHHHHDPIPSYYSPTYSECNFLYSLPPMADFQELNEHNDDVDDNDDVVALPGKEQHCFVDPQGEVLGGVVAKNDYVRLLNQRGINSSNFVKSMCCTEPVVNNNNNSNNVIKSQSYSISSASSTIGPVCRFCHLPAEANGKPLFSPCRCKGTASHIHHDCLMTWIKVCKRKNKQEVPFCEICCYSYRRRKVFAIKEMQLPAVSRHDMKLHVITLFCLLLILLCAVVTIFFFFRDKPKIMKEEKRQYIISRNDSSSTTIYKEGSISLNEVVTLICSITFFISFFVVMVLQIKSRHSLYNLLTQLFRGFWVWQILPYLAKKDHEMLVMTEFQMCSNNESRNNSNSNNVSTNNTNTTTTVTTTNSLNTSSGRNLFSMPRPHELMTLTSSSPPLPPMHNAYAESAMPYSTRNLYNNTPQLFPSYHHYRIPQQQHYQIVPPYVTAYYPASNSFSAFQLPLMGNPHHRDVSGGGGGVAHIAAPNFNS